MLLSAYLKTPPSGYKKVSVEQCQLADLEVLNVMMRRTRDGIRPNAQGIMPLEAALLVAMDSTEVRLYLQPLQGNDKGSTASDSNKRKRGDGGEEGQGSEKTVAKLRKTIEGFQSTIRNLQSNASSGSGGAKGSGKKGENKPKSFIRLPFGLIGQSATNPKGRPICFDFNLGGCSKAKAGEKCERGWHVCSKPGCGKPEPQTTHASHS